MRFIAKVKNGRIHMPRVENAKYVEVIMTPIYIDPSTANTLPETFKI